MHTFLDIDGVLTNNQASLSKFLGREIDLCNYNFKNLPESEVKLIFNVYSKLSKTFALQCISNKKLIPKLYGCPFSILTARNPKNSKETMKWLERYSIRPQYLFFFTDKEKFFGEVLPLIDSDIKGLLIDDCIAHVHKVNEKTSHKALAYTGCGNNFIEEIHTLKVSLNDTINDVTLKCLSWLGSLDNNHDVLPVLPKSKITELQEKFPGLSIKRCGWGRP